MAAMVDPETGQGMSHNAFIKFVTEAVRFRRRKIAVNADASSGRIPWSTKITYALPQFSLTSLTMLIGIHGTIFFTKLGADVAFIAFFTALARSFDVLTDPLMGYISDKTRTKWGRRRPYMFFGCFFYSLMFILLFNPPAFESGTSVAIWFGIFYLCFYLFDTIGNVPYSALGPELSDVSSERDNLFFWARLVNAIGIFMGAVGPVAAALSFKSRTSECQVCDTECPLGPGAAAALSAPWNATEWGSMPDSWYNASSCGQANFDRMPATIQSWCLCYNDCDASCDIAVNRTAFMAVSLVFGVYYFFAMMACVFCVKERKFKQLDTEGTPPPPPLVPSLLATMRNKPFMGLLPAWVCDMTAYTMIGTMLPFFLEYVVVPGSVPECEDGKRAAFGMDPVAPENESEDWCDSQIWLALGLVCLIGAQILSMPLWLRLTKCVGKFRTWLLYNLAIALTNGLFVLIGRGDPKFSMVLAVVNGLPAGAIFLTDSVVADVIDYDELLTGQRSEGRFTIFQTFLPKIVSVPAQAVPLALLSFFGFVAPVKGVPQEQPQGVKWFIQLVFFMIPCGLSLISFWLKTKFPINKPELTEQITRGAAFHLKGQPALDPLTGNYISLFKFKDEAERRVSWDLDNFFKSQLKKMLELGPTEGAKHLAASMKRTVWICVGGAVTALVLTLLSVILGLLDNDKWSWLPAFSVISFGMLTSAAAFNHVRHKAALKLCEPEHAVSREFLERWVEHLHGQSKVPAESVAAVEKLHNLAASQKSLQQLHSSAHNDNDDDDVMPVDQVGANQARQRKVKPAGAEVEMTARPNLPHQVE